MDSATPSSRTSTAYRPDIDGLRAVAITGVVIQHSGLGLGGGFTGVDVFLVISGFLITRLVCQDLESGSFSFARFWERRARRILPASFFLLAVVPLLGACVLLPGDFADLSTSALSQMVMASNIYFWRTMDYFNAAAETKPLLHTWSLAVEEQFYLLYPVMLWAMRRLRKNSMIAWLAAAALVSFGLNLASTFHRPVAAFYLLPTRAWELLVGGILAVGCGRMALRKRSVCEAVSWCGLIAIGLSMVRFDATTPFPGAAACLPVGGAAAVILGNTSRRTTCARLLALPPVVGIGLVSYSWYLWHWPLLAILRYATGADFERWDSRLACVVLSLALAVLSWRRIELPFRSRRIAPSRRSLALTLAASFILLLGVHAGIRATGGWPNRFPAEVLEMIDEQSLAEFPAPTLDEIRADRVPILGDAGVRPIGLLWGDSHALVLRKLFDNLGREYGVGTYSVAREDEPITPSGSRDRNEAVLAFIRRARPRHVFLVSRWSDAFDGLLRHRPQLIDAAEREHRRRAPRDLCDTLAGLGCRVWIMLEVPCQPGGDPYRSQLVLSRVWPEVCRVARTTRDEHEAFTANSRKTILETVPESVGVIDPEATCFDAEGVSIVFHDGKPCYWDDDHLSDAGTRHLLEPLWRPVFKAIAEDE
ncbi:MAG: acyltransferase [Planctomycetes bacterium]|nr:acyltransferase [Planctomycetota bacterium]